MNHHSPTNVTAG